MALNFPSSPSANATYTYSGKSWTYNGNAWALTSGTLSTTVVPEGTNLYFSNARVYSNVVTLGYATNSNVALKANVIDLTTANVTEVTNLYFSNARVSSALLSTGDIIPSGNNIQTLGNVTNRFKDLFLSGNTIYLGNVVLQSTTTTFQVADTGGNVIFNAVDGSGFITSTVFSFPGSAGNSDYGDLTPSIDAFGVSTASVYNCMEPTGRSLTTDLGTL
jgi:3D (Asp-Asp-Asp) domain-containing protein